MKIRIPSDAVIESRTDCGRGVYTFELSFNGISVDIHKPVRLLTDLGDLFLEEWGDIDWIGGQEITSIKTMNGAYNLYSKDFKRTCWTSCNLEAVLRLNPTIKTSNKETSIWSSRRFNGYEKLSFVKYQLCRNAEHEWFLWE